MPDTAKTDTDNPAAPQAFWDWSMANYVRPGIADRLLRLQDDYGYDVNLVLWCVWAGRSLAPIGESDVASLFGQAEEWAERVTIPLRGVRRWMKGQDLPADDEAVSSLRGEVKALELRAERISQDMLEDQSRLVAGEGEAAPDSPTRYFSVYLTHRQAQDTHEQAKGLATGAQEEKNQRMDESEEIFAQLMTLLSGEA